MKELTTNQISHVYFIWDTLRSKELIEMLQNELDETNEDFQKLFNINNEQCELLKELLNGNINKIYNTINNSKDHNLVSEIISESIHHDLDGWEDWEKVIIYRYLMDLNIAIHIAESTVNELDLTDSEIEKK